MLAAVVTIDTEADHGPSWVKSSPLQFRSVVEAIPRVLTPLFARHRARPTYLVTTEVMNHGASVDALASLQDAELGTHLHGEHVEPDARVPDPTGAASWDFTCSYPAELERAKLDTLTRQFRNCFGRQPLSYRAGRYAASAQTARSLVDLGYLVETSVTPGIEWVNEIHSEHRVDFRHAPTQPYRPSERDLAESGTLPIWEVPVTILRKPASLHLGMQLVRRALGRESSDSSVWLRPSTTSRPWLRWMVHEIAAGPGLRVFNIMFHTMELVVGASPVSTTKADTARIIRRLDYLLGLLARHGVRFYTLTELAHALEQRR